MIGLLWLTLALVPCRDCRSSSSTFSRFSTSTRPSRAGRNPFTSRKGAPGTLSSLPTVPSLQHSRTSSDGFARRLARSQWVRTKSARQTGCTGASLSVCSRIRAWTRSTASRRGELARVAQWVYPRFSRRHLSTDLDYAPYQLGELFDHGCDGELFYPGDTREPDVDGAYSF